MKRVAEARQRLIELFQLMYTHTNEQCRTCKPRPFSCCDAMYCELAKQYAKEQWGMELKPAEPPHDELPFMGPTGCIVAPHLRPLCTLHTCTMNALGFSKDAKWDRRYHELRAEINAVSAQAFPSGVLPSVWEPSGPDAATSD